MTVNLRGKHILQLNQVQVSVYSHFLISSAFNLTIIHQTRCTGQLDFIHYWLCFRLSVFQCFQTEHSAALKWWWPSPVCFSTYGLAYLPTHSHLHCKQSTNKRVDEDTSDMWGATSTRWSREATLTFVVVSVTIGVVAFPINPPVFFIAHVNASKKLIRTLVSRCSQDCSYEWERKSLQIKKHFQGKKNKCFLLLHAKMVFYDWDLFLLIIIKVIKVTILCHCLKQLLLW